MQSARFILAATILTAGCQPDTVAPTTEADRPGAAMIALAEGTWTTRAAYPRDIWDAASASVTNQSTLRSVVYVIGGQPKLYNGPGSISDLVKAYDVTANSWSTKAPYPVRLRSSNGAVEINGKIYVTGGFTRRYDAQADVYGLEEVRSVYAYDPATNAWTRRADMPLASVEGVSMTYKGLLYVATSCNGSPVCGGTYDGGALWRFNPATNVWSFLTKTPHDPNYGGGGFIGGKLYLVAVLGATDIYDLATNTWSTGPHRPIRYCTPAYTTFDAKLYLAGCHDDFDNSGVYPMQVLNPATGSWSQAAAPPYAVGGNLYSFSRVVVNGTTRLELLGGASPTNNLQYTP